MSNPPVLPAATLADVKAVIDGLPVGVYMSSDLYDRYTAVMADQGRQPVSPQALGRMFREFGLLRRQRQGRNAWMIQ